MTAQPEFRIKRAGGTVLVAGRPGCHDCPSWQRRGGNASPCGTCTDNVSPHHRWLTSYAAICRRHPSGDGAATAAATRTLVEGDGPDLGAIVRGLQSP